MSKFFFGYGFIIIFFYCCFSCDNNSTVKKSILPPLFRIEKKDSIITKRRGDFRILSYDTLYKTVLIFLSDSKSVVRISHADEVLDSFCFSNHPEIEDGRFIDQIGVFSDSLLIVGSVKGYFFYNFKGHLIKQVYSPANFKGGIFPQIEYIGLKNKDTFLVTTVRDTVVNKYNERNNKSYYNSYRSLSILNLNTKSIANYIPFEENSVFKKFDYYYANKFSLFKTTKDSNLIYLLQNPQASVYVYKLFNNTRCSLINEIDLHPSFFKTVTPRFHGKSNNEEIIKLIGINSQYTSLQVYKDYFLTCYSSGVPKDKYNEMNSATEYKEYYKKYNRNYLQIFKNSQKQGGDIVIPNDIYKIDIFLGPECLVAKGNELFAKQIDKDLIYIYKLQKI